MHLLMNRVILTGLLLLNILLVFFSPQAGLETLYQFIIVLGAILICETTIHFLKGYHLILYSSSNGFISAMIISLLLPPRQVPVLALILIGVITSLSSEFIRHQNRPIFNPTALALIITSFIYSSLAYIWSPNAFLAPTVLLSIIVITLSNRWHLVAGFCAPLLIAGLVNIFQSNNYSTFNLLVGAIFFMGIMLIEPRSSPLNTHGQVFFGIIIGLSYLFLNSEQLKNPLLLALLIGNIAVPLLNNLFIQHNHQNPVPDLVK